MTDKPSTSLITKPLRCSYVNVFSPRLNEQSGFMEYGCEMLIPKDDKETLDKIRTAMKAAMTQKFSEKKQFVVDTFLTGMKEFFKTGRTGFTEDDDLYFAVRDGDLEKTEGEDGKKILLKTVRPEVAGHYLLRCKAKENNKPDVIDKDREDVMDKTAFVSGDYGRLMLNCSAFETKGNRGCSFWLNGVQVWKKGEPLGSGKVDAKKAFDDDFEDADWD